MPDKNSISNFIDGFINNVKSIDGKIVGEDLQPSKVRLAKDEKGAMVNDIVDQYLRKELTNEYLEQVKEEYGITTKDIVREIAKREIEKITRM